MVPHANCFDNDGCDTSRCGSVEGNGEGLVAIRASQQDRAKPVRLVIDKAQAAVLAQLLTLFSEPGPG